MAYKIFEGRWNHGAHAAAMSFDRSGHCGFNKRVSDALLAKGSRFVLLYWNSQTSTIGVLPLVDKNDRRSYRISLTKRGVLTGFRAKMFLEWIKYDYGSGKSRTFPAHWNSQEQMFEIKLPDDATLSA